MSATGSGELHSLLEFLTATSKLVGLWEIFGNRMPNSVLRVCFKKVIVLLLLTVLLAGAAFDVGFVDVGSF